MAQRTERQPRSRRGAGSGSAGATASPPARPVRRPAGSGARRRARARTEPRRAGLWQAPSKDVRAAPPAWPRVYWARCHRRKSEWHSTGRRRPVLIVGQRRRTSAVDQTVPVPLKFSHESTPRAVPARRSSASLISSSKRGSLNRYRTNRPSGSPTTSPHSLRHRRWFEAFDCDRPVAPTISPTESGPSRRAAKIDMREKSAKPRKSFARNSTT